jgi:cell division protein FtsI (penicillin-binding protein 3)
VVLAKGLDITTARAALQTKLPGTNLTIPGLVSKTDETRAHPAGVVAAQVVGVTRPLDQVLVRGQGYGSSGIEYTMNKVLTGSPGTITEEVDPAGRVIPEGENKDSPAVQGSDVRLTIDRDVQYEAQTVLDQEVKNTNARGGHIVVMDPRSGELLAIASSPGFDASQWASATIPASALTLPAVTDPYEPGSVNKVITAAAALDTGAYSPNDAITVESELHVPGRPQPIKDAELHGTEHLTFTGVLAESSNIGTVHIAETLGNQTLYKYLTAFGLGSSTKSGLPGESAGLLPNVTTWNASNAATIPFGQGMAATALQIASVYATVANGGVRVTPSIVRGVISPDGSYAPSKKAPGVRVISQKAASTLSTMLETVATGVGTAPVAAIPGYRIAGKTGTAQALTKGVYDGGYVSSFVGFAPADNPRLVVSVVLDHPQGSYFGGAVAAPVFRAVMGFALRDFKVMPTGTRRPQLRLTYDAPTAPVAPVTAVTPVTGAAPVSAAPAPSPAAIAKGPVANATPSARPAGSAAPSP